jgi:hypothetical protein
LDRARLKFALNQQELWIMKKLMIASACALALSMGGAFAQSQPAPGASSKGNVGPGATETKKPTKHMKKGMTTGMGAGTASRKGISANPSSSGNVGPGTNNNNGPQPGGR